MDIVDQNLRIEDENQANPDQHDLRCEISNGKDQIELRGLLSAANVDQGKGSDQNRTADDVAGTIAQPRPEDRQVVGHKEG